MSESLSVQARKLVMVHCHLRMLRMQKEGKWEEDLLEWHEAEDEMWEVREEGGRRQSGLTRSGAAGL